MSKVIFIHDEAPWKSVAPLQEWWQLTEHEKSVLKEQGHFKTLEDIDLKHKHHPHLKPSVFSCSGL